MTIVGRVCSLTVMDESDPNIHFDEFGVCNHVLEARRRLENEVFRGTDGQRRLAEVVEDAKREGIGRDYDCVIGVSGGLDSSYVALQMKRLGLRPLAVHLDNGWNSELAVSNIEALLRKTDIDLHTEVLDWEEFRDIQRAFFRASVPNVEVATDHAITAALLRTASRVGSRFIFTGSNVATESIMPEVWSYDLRDSLHIRAVHRLFGSGRALNSFPLMEPLELLRHFILDRIRYIPILNYIGYEKPKALTELREEIGWRPYKRKHGESRFTRFFQEYYLPEKFGYDKRKAHFSSLIVAGQMTREEALAELQKPMYSHAEREIDIEYVSKKLGFSLPEWKSVMEAPPANHTAFPNRAWMFSRKQPLAKMVRQIAKGEAVFFKHSRSAVRTHGSVVVAHAYFSELRHESRMLRATNAVLSVSKDGAIVWIGHRSPTSGDEERPHDRLLLRRIGPKPVKSLPRVPFRIFQWLVWTWQLRSVLKEYQPAVIQAHGLATMPAAVLAKRSLGVPLVFDAHELETERQGWGIALKLTAKLLESHVIREADRMLVVSERIRAWYESHHPGVRPILVRNIPTLPTGSQPSELRSRLAIPDDDLVFLYIGQLGLGRGLYAAIEAFKKVAPNKHLVMMGAGPESEHIKREISGFSNLHLHPAVPSDSVVYTAAGADVGLSLIEDTCLSYRYCLPNKLFECLQAGLPVIVSNLPEQEEFVRNYDCGWSVSPTPKGIRNIVNELNATSIRLAAKRMKAPPTWASEKEVYLSVVGPLITPDKRSDIR